ncbi:chemotaxis protein CheB [Parasegetibacter sp. NRK P23]|uniref:chemotaxis protein CheB n=1 Tax=Parasegetibacter sp. NRK P23 TaxID=2942999 RepID=UPI002044B972|nr:chemotaxis protein CheB [Parasegetibacter sp. NRK P23]MCM5528109.1 chemotaxis protein CheB [Parasegetibacter sp. NRK P23]
MAADKYDIIMIGGSAGSLHVISELIDALPESFQTPVVVVMHRLRNVQSEMTRLVSDKRRLKEPEDKEFIAAGTMYLAPQNYHLMVEADKSFALDYSELVNYSRPSIDVSFQSTAPVYESRALVILLSGANKDGAAGVASVLEHGGTALVQRPDLAEYKSMPEAALRMNSNAQGLSITEMISFIKDNCK